MHSIRKGGCYLYGGTSSGSISVNGGWSMGRVKDIDVQWYEHLWEVLMWSTHVTSMILFLSPYIFKIRNLW